MRHNLAHFHFLFFQNKNILRSDLNFSTIYGRGRQKARLGLAKIFYFWKKNKPKQLASFFEKKI